MAKSETSENLRVRLDPILKGRLDELFQRKRIKQQDAVEAVMQWLVEQDDLLQSMIFGQVDSSRNAQLMDLVMEGMAKKMEAQDLVDLGDPKAKASSESKPKRNRSQSNA